MRDLAAQDLETKTEMRRTSLHPQRNRHALPERRRDTTAKALRKAAQHHNQIRNRILRTTDGDAGAKSTASRLGTGAVATLLLVAIDQAREVVVVNARVLPGETTRDHDPLSAPDPDQGNH